MRTSAGRPFRRSVRLENIDGVVDASWMITICTADRMELFGRWVPPAVELSALGNIVEDEWRQSSILRPEVQFGDFSILPDHFHGILFVPRNELGIGSTPLHRAPRSLASLVSQFKGAVTRRCRDELQLPTLDVWQRGFHDRGIRDPRQLECCTKYVVENAANWRRIGFARG